MPVTLPAIDNAAQLRATIGRLSRRLRPTAAAREAGLTPTKVSVLLHVDRAETVRLSELAAAEGINPTMLSRVIADLVADGLVARSCDEDDRRSAWVSATRAGNRLAERMRRERTDALGAALEKLSESDRRRIERSIPALDALAEALRR